MEIKNIVFEFAKDDAEVKEKFSQKFGDKLSDIKVESLGGLEDKAQIMLPLLPAFITSIATILAALIKTGEKKNRVIAFINRKTYVFDGYSEKEIVKILKKLV